MAYTLSKKIVIDHTKCGSSDSSNFPVLFSGTYVGSGSDPDLRTVANGGPIQSSSGFDIIFSSTLNPADILDFEIDTYSATDGKVAFWIRIPTLSASVDTEIYILYSNTSISTSQENITGTWNSNFRAVYHFGDGSTLKTTDSTSHANNATNNNGVTAGASLVNGSGGGCASFDASLSQFLDCGNDSSIQLSTALTIELWGEFTANPNALQLFLGNRSTDGYAIFYHGNAVVTFKLYASINKSTVETDIFMPGDMAQLTKYHIVITYDNSTFILYVNGTSVASTSVANACGASTDQLFIGKFTSTPFYLTGYVDEMRVAATANTADWVTANWNNQNSPGTFYSIISSAAPLTVSKNDTLALSESSSVSLLNAQFFGVVKSDSLSLSDAIALIGGDPDFHLLFGDRLNLLDNVSFPASSILKTASDALVLLDNSLVRCGIPVAVFDSQQFNWAELIVTSLRAPLARTASDTLALSDFAATLIGNVIISLLRSDTLTLSDALRLFQVLRATAEDNFVFSDDSGQYLFKTFARFAESINNFSDAALLKYSTGPQNPTDSFSLTDSVSLQLPGQLRLSIDN